MGIFKMKFIKRSARKLQEQWLLKALAYEDPDELPDEVLHIAQMYAHAMEIENEQDAFVKIEKAKKEWKTLNTMIQGEKIKEQQKQYAKSTTKGKATRRTKKVNAEVRDLGPVKQAPGDRPTTRAPRRGNGRKK
jgi:hypothetical protein